MLKLRQTKIIIQKIVVLLQRTDGSFKMKKFILFVMIVLTICLIGCTKGGEAKSSIPPLTPPLSFASTIQSTTTNVFIKNYIRELVEPRGDISLSILTSISTP